SKNPAGFIRAFLICHENHRVMNAGKYQRAHMLPRGFQRIRHCGFLAHRVRQSKLTPCRPLLRPPAGVPPAMRVEAKAPPGQADRGMGCPACQRGQLAWGETLHPQPAVYARETPPAGGDTSSED